MRTLTSFVGRRVETESGRRLGKCRDLKASLGRGRPRVQAVLVGRGGWLEHFGLGGGRKFRDAVPWEAVVRVEGARIIVRDGTELE